MLFMNHFFLTFTKKHIFGPNLTSNAEITIRVPEKNEFLGYCLFLNNSVEPKTTFDQCNVLIWANLIPSG